jgi:hypothetical protein
MNRPYVIEVGSLTLDKSGIAINGWHVHPGSMPECRAAIVVAVRDYVIKHLGKEPGVPALVCEDAPEPIDAAVERAAETEVQLLIARCRGYA